MSELLLRAGRWEQVTPELAGWDFLYFGVRSGSFASETGDGEIALVTLGGTCRVEAEGETWELGGRENVFAGMPWALYLPRETAYRVVGDAEVAICGARAGGPRCCDARDPGADGVYSGGTDSSPDQRARRANHRARRGAYQTGRFTRGCSGGLAFDRRVARRGCLARGKACRLTRCRGLTWSARVQKIHDLIASRLRSAAAEHGVWSRVQARAWRAGSRRWLVHLMRERSVILPPVRLAPSRRD